VKLATIIREVVIEKFPLEKVWLQPHSSLTHWSQVPRTNKKGHSMGWPGSRETGESEGDVWSHSLGFSSEDLVAGGNKANNDRERSTKGTGFTRMLNSAIASTSSKAGQPYSDSNSAVSDVDSEPPGDLEHLHKSSSGAIGMVNQAFEGNNGGSSLSKKESTHCPCEPKKVPSPTSNTSSSWFGFGSSSNNDQNCPCEPKEVSTKANSNGSWFGFLSSDDTINCPCDSDKESPKENSSEAAEKANKSEDKSNENAKESTNKDAKEIAGSGAKENSKKSASEKITESNSEKSPKKDESTNKAPDDGKGGLYQQAEDVAYATTEKISDKLREVFHPEAFDPKNSDCPDDHYERVHKPCSEVTGKHGSSFLSSISNTSFSSSDSGKRSYKPFQKVSFFNGAKKKKVSFFRKYFCE